MNLIERVFDNKDESKVNSKKRTEKYSVRKPASEKRKEYRDPNREAANSTKVPNDLPNRRLIQSRQVTISSPQRPEAQTTVQPEVQINKEALKQELIEFKNDLKNLISTKAQNKLLKLQQDINAQQKNSISSITQSEKNISKISPSIMELLQSTQYSEIKKAIFETLRRNDINYYYENYVRTFERFLNGKSKLMNKMFSYLSELLDLGDGEWSKDITNAFTFSYEISNRCPDAKFQLEYIDYQGAENINY